MKRYFLFLILNVIFLSQNVFAQQDSFDLPSFVPLSPDVYQFTQYGDVPVNESSGRINLSIPLLDYKVGTLSTYVGLSYVGNGIKLNEYPTDTGMTWVLNGVGIINRTVNGRRDEVSNRQYLTTEDLNAMDLQDGTDDTVVLNQLLNHGSNDTERDQFDFSFLGYSGSFYLSENLEPILVDKSSNLRIEVLTPLGTSNTFIITTPDGIKYYFGSQEIGTSFLRNNSGAQLTPANITSYYMYKIENLTGDVINFEYEQYGDRVLSSLRFLMLDDDEYGDISYQEILGNCAYPPLIPSGFSLTGEVDAREYSQEIYRHSINQRLKKITTNNISANGFIDFEYSELERGRLDRIVYKTPTSTINQVDLIYFDSNFSRFFLEEVIIHNDKSSSLDNQKQRYRMVYNDPSELPNQFSYCQDLSGYYNAKTSNRTLMSKNNFVDFEPYNEYFADRTMDFDKAIKGSISKVYYPTGGYTEFEYESPKMIETIYDDVSINTYHNFSQLIPSSVYTQTFSTLGAPGFATPAFGNHDIDIKIDVTIEAGTLNKHLRPEIQITDLTTGISESYNFALGLTTGTVSQLYTISHNQAYSLIDGHNYEFKLAFKSPFDGELDQSWPPISVRASFKYVIGEQWIDSQSLRIKTVKDYSEDNTLANTKRFYYKEAKHIVLGQDDNYNESRLLNFEILSDNKTYSITESGPCRPEGGGLSLTCTNGYRTARYMEYNSAQKGSFGNRNVLYNVVTTSLGGDNFENGGTEKTFYISSTDNTFTYHNALIIGEPYGFRNKSNLNYLSGKLLEEKIIRKNNASNELTVIKKTESTYDLSVSQFLSNMVGKHHNTCLGPFDYDNQYIALYNFNTFNSHLLRQKITTYPDPPLLDEDENLVSKIITSTDFEYGDLAGLPIKITNTDSEGNELIVRNYYPYQVTSSNSLNLLPNLTTEELNAIDNLKTNIEHRIATPIQIETYLKESDLPEKMLSAQRNTFKVFNNGFTHLEGISSSKDNSNFEKRIRYYDYDSDGNPLVVSKEDGTKIIYVWSNTFNKPIASIINATLQEVQNATGSLRTALPHAQVTTYTYSVDPLHLLLSITDPKGDAIHYSYDEFYRLKHIKDRYGNILSSTEYNYKN